jgi:hypothetical protein
VLLTTLFLIVREDEPQAIGTLGALGGLRWLLGGAPEPCRFVSPVDAYRRDLERLRAVFPALNVTSYSHSHSPPLRPRPHTFSPTGHLLFSPDSAATHPIPQLLAVGELKWEELLAKQSRTLREAVDEYVRRYARPPPRGFDTWWATFAVGRELVLPDEYDRIDRDLAPFRALPPAELRRRIAAVEAMPEVFVLDINKGKVKAKVAGDGLQWEGTKSRANDMARWVVTFSDGMGLY